jgi:hypothetical protein
MSRTKADEAYELRSRIVHGCTIQHLGKKELELYDKLDNVLRQSIRKAIEDEPFQKIFKIDAKIESEFGVVPNVPAPCTIKT